MTVALFPEPEHLPTPSRMGEDARRTLRARAQLDAGRHPVAGIPLHPDAPPPGDRDAPGPRCGTCAHLCRRTRSHTWLKCGEHATHSAATDLRAWWPGCAVWTAETAAGGAT